MGPAGRRCYRLLLRLVPRGIRETVGAELEAAAVACLARERARAGRLGVAAAWCRLSADAATTGLALRWSTASTASIGPGLGGRRPSSWERFMDNFRKDLLYALRGLRRQPGFALVTILTLALGIGANTAIFSVVNGVLLRPLPYPHADRLELITSQFPALGFTKFWVSPPEYVEFRDHNESFSSVGAYAIDAANLGTNPPTRPVTAAVTPELMQTLGVPPRLGRPFTAADTAPGAPPVAILSDELWRRAYGGDTGILGRKVQIDDVSTEIVGVMPPGFDIHDQKVELWTPLGWTPADLAQRRGNHYLYLVGRLKDGVTVAAAQADLERMLGHWKPDLIEFGSGHAPNLTTHRLQMAPLKEDIVGGVRTALLMLQGAVVFVLLIACANLANLLLARAESRQREFAVRAALGAGRTRLLRQLVTEGLLLALAGAAIGVSLALAAIRTLLSVNPDALPRTANVALDWRVLGFTLALAVVTGVLFGLAPLTTVSRRLSAALRDGTRTTGGRLQKAVRGTLVVAEVTFAVMLVVGAGLLVRSFVNLMRVDLGFDRSHLVTFSVVKPMFPMSTDEARVAQRVRVVGFFDQLQTRLAALPGVQGVTDMSGLPPNRSVDANDTDFEWIPDMPDPDPKAPKYPPQNVDYWQYVGRDYAKTMGIPVVEGRAFRAGDEGGPPVVLVNETLAKKYFVNFGRDPVGERLKPGGGKDVPWFTIVGVLKDVKQGGVDAPTGTEIYLLQRQMIQLGVNGNMNIVLRTTQSASALAGPIRAALHDIDPTLPIVKLQSMDEVVDTAVARPRFIVVLLGLFAALALALAAVGTYGVLSYLVTRQQQEIGIRMALGADRFEILRHFLVRGLTLAGLGLLVGIGGSLVVTRLIQSLLFDVAPTDPATFAGVALVIALVAAAACLVPAWRATRVDPLTVLRES